MLAEAIEAAAPLAQAKGIALDRRAGRRHACGRRTDRARMIQVVGNLLTNAIKFTPAAARSPPAWCATAAAPRSAYRDTGIGIPESQLQDIFNPFVQGAQDAARSQGGLGLGLSLVQQIVAMHDGEVAAYSGAAWPDGSEFVVSLPAVAAAESAAAAAVLAALARTPIDAGRGRQPGRRGNPARIVLDASAIASDVDHDGGGVAMRCTANVPTRCCWTSACPASAGSDWRGGCGAQPGPRPG